MINSEKVETEDLSKKADKVEKSKDAATIIKECEEIIDTKNKNLLYPKLIIKEKCLEDLNRSL